jgi:hypothetical protein
MKAKTKKSPRYFHLPRGDDRPIVEGMWVSTFLKAARFSVRSLVARRPGEDPPDCEAIVDGAWAGIEAIELVHDETAASFDHWVQHFVWQQPSFLARAQSIIEGKDGKRWLGGPYDRKLLVIYTNELYLPRDKVKLWLADHHFRTAVFDHAVLGFSYHIKHRHLRPAFRLKLVRPDTCRG